MDKSCSHESPLLKTTTFLYCFLQQNYIEMTIQTSKKKSVKEHNHVITFNYVITKLKIKVATGKIGLYY